MKMKYLVLCASCLALAVGVTWANDGPEVIRDKATLVFYQFNDPTNYKKDSGPWKNNITGDFPSGTGKDGVSYGMYGVGSGNASNGYDGSGYLKIDGRNCTKTGWLSDTYESVKTTFSLVSGSFNGTTSPYFTILMRIKSDVSLGSSPAFLKEFSDTGRWHMVATRYQVGTGSSNPYMSVIDPGLLWEGVDFWGNKNRPEVAGSSMKSMPFGISGAIVNVGGDIYSSSYNFRGAMDDLVIVNRMMTKWEITRFFLTGETYVYSDGDPSFAAASGWSSNKEGDPKFKPGDIPGQAYIVDGGMTITQGATATFGGDGFTGSLTMGRLEPLMNRVANPNAVLVAASAGNLAHNTANTTITIGDLRLRKGKITSGAAGQTLAATKLEVVAPTDAPYEIAVGSGTYTVTGSASGDGWLKKTGTGTLDLRGLTGAAKVVVTEGKVLAGPNVTVSYDLEEDRGAVPVLMVE